MSKNGWPVFAGLVSSVATLQTAELYQVKDLGAIANLTGRDDAGPRAISSDGKVAGSNVTNGAYRAFLYIGAWTNLGTLGGDESLASGVSGSGQVVGRSLTNGSVTRAFLWTPGATDGVSSNPQMRDLGALPGGADSEAVGINRAGQITGYSQNGAYDRAIRYAGGTMTDIGGLLGNSLPNSYGLGINDAGHIVGLAYNRNFTTPHAFFYNGATAVDIGRAGDSGASALAINNGDHVTGYLTTSNGFDRAFHYFNGVMTELDTLGGHYAYGIGINNSNVIVGGSFIDQADSLYHAFIAVSNVPVDLNQLVGATGAGWTLTEARAINDAGQIVGVGNYNGGLHACLLYGAPTLTDVRVSGSNVLVSFSTVSGALYILLGRGEVAGGAWSNAVMGIVGNGSNVTVTNFGVLTLPRQFYRAKLGSP